MKVRVKEEGIKLNGTWKFQGEEAVIDEEQYERLLMQYEQLKNGSIDIAGMIERGDYDSAITMIKSREDIFLNCKCIMNYLELTPVQKKEIDKQKKKATKW